MPSPIKAVGLCPRHEGHLPGFAHMASGPWTGITRTDSGLLGDGAGNYVTPHDPGHPGLPAGEPRSRVRRPCRTSLLRPEQVLGKPRRFKDVGVRDAVATPRKQGPDKM
jgi:hypothetical protein